MARRDGVRAVVLAALALCAQAAQAGYAGLWFQCQPRWQAEKNYLLVNVKQGERAWDARWGEDETARGPAGQDAQGNLALRGCHARKGVTARGCDPTRPPTFAVLPNAVAGEAPPVETALRRGRWLRTDKAGLEKLARQCAALRTGAGPAR